MIFFNYAREDKSQVDDTFRALKAAGLDPWMDEPPAPFEAEGLSPGVRWDDELRRKLMEADVFLAFLTRRSTTKEGYVQREIRLGLNRVAEMPTSRPFVIPVLLEPCDVPDVRIDTVNLQHFQAFPLYIRGPVGLINHLQRMRSDHRPGNSASVAEAHMEWNRTTWDPQLCSINGFLIIYIAWLAKEFDVAIDLKEVIARLATVDYLYAYGFLVALRAAQLVVFRTDYKTTWRFNYVNPLLVKSIKADIEGRYEQAMADEDLPIFSSDPYDADLRVIEDYIRERSSSREVTESNS